MQIEIATVTQYIFQGLFAIIGSVCVYTLRQFNSKLSDLSGGQEKLNNQIAIIIERTTWHEKELERHEDRIKDLERGKN